MKYTFDIAARGNDRFTIANIAAHDLNAYFLEPRVVPATQGPNAVAARQQCLDKVST
jgi:hypothetical protein